MIMMYENVVLKVDSYLVELIARGVPYDELVGFYDYTIEEMLAACKFIEVTPFEILMEMLEAAAQMRQSIAG